MQPEPDEIVIEGEQVMAVDIEQTKIDEQEIPISDPVIPEICAVCQAPIEDERAQRTNLCNIYVVDLYKDILKMLQVCYVFYKYKRA